jgi:hypothetical protein
MSAKTERDKRKEQRLKELQDKKDRLRRLKEKNQTEFAPKVCPPLTFPVALLPSFSSSLSFL